MAAGGWGGGGVGGVWGVGGVARVAGCGNRGGFFRRGIRNREFAHSDLRVCTFCAQGIPGNSGIISIIPRKTPENGRPNPPNYPEMANNYRFPGFAVACGYFS